MSGTFEDLEVWRASMDLVSHIYEISRHFPKQELYGLTGQLRRAAVSIPSNIAEGKGRISDKELVQFLCHARGSLYEVDTQLQIAEKLGFAPPEKCSSLRQELARVGQLLNGFIRSVRPAR